MKHTHSNNLNKFEIFHYNGNQILIVNARRYTVKFANGVEAEYSDNIISEDIWEQYYN